MSVLIVSNILLWITNIALILAVLALARQVGVLYERVAPLGALTMDQGPKIGDAAPVFTLPLLDGGEAVLGRATGRSQLLFFLSPDCPVCKKLLPILRSLAAAERHRIDVILASDGAPAEHLTFVRREKLASFPYVLSAELGMAYRIGKLPYAVVVGPDGRIAAKGLVNNREQIESLLVAQELGVGSLQDYLGKTGRDRPASAAE